MSRKRKQVSETEDWSCPNCQALWGIEEYDWQECDSCGYPDNIDDEDDYDHEDDYGDWPE